MVRDVLNALVRADDPLLNIMVGMSIPAGIFGIYALFCVIREFIKGFIEEFIRLTKENN